MTMKRTAAFFLVQLKRMLQTLPFVLIVSVCICVCLGMTLSRVITTYNNSEDKQKFTIALVGETDSSYLGFGISALKSIDISKYMIDFTEMSEEDARDALKRGEVQSIVIIPDGFVDALIDGEVRSLTYVTTNSAVGITTMFKDEMLSAIAVMLVESQNGIYGLHYAMRDHGVDEDFWAHSDALSMEYFNLILSRADLYMEEIIGVSGGLSFGGYMLSGISVLLIFLCGISCAKLLVKRDMALPRLLRAGGYTSLLQVASEYLAYFVLMLVDILVIIATAAVACRDAVSIVPELAGYGTLDMLALAFSIVPAVMLITASQYLLYELSSNLVNGVLLQFVCAISLAYIGGCFYPISFFPRAIQTLARFLPSGMAREYLSDVVLGRVTLWGTLTPLVFTCVLILLSALVRKRRILFE